MKKVFFVVYTVLSLAFLSCSGDIFDNIKEHASEEEVYVGKFDKAEVKVGLNRLEIDLLDAGRIPAADVNIGKAVKTIVEYDGKTITYEQVPSWLNITGLTEPKLYRIKIYNIDEHGNKSMPVEVAAIPFTRTDSLNIIFPIPTKLLAPKSVQFNWPNGLDSEFFDFYEMEYSYTDAEGPKTLIKSTLDSTAPKSRSLTVFNLIPAVTDSVRLKAKIVPKQNGVPILDTMYIELSVGYLLPTEEQYLSERENRKVEKTYIERNTASITWLDPTDHLAVTEFVYETVSGTFDTIQVDTRTKTVKIEDAKADVPYKTRCGFLPPGAVDTLYREWVESKYPFFSIPDGTYVVSSDSYRYFEDSGEPTADRPQAEYAGTTMVELKAKLEEGAYELSDLFGGYYEPGRGYGEGYITPGTFSLEGHFVEAKTDPWGYGWTKADVISWDFATKTLVVDIYWDGTYVFRLVLVKE
jgi:hypothetical protein